MSQRNEKRSYGFTFFILVSIVSFLGFLWWHKGALKIQEQGSSDNEMLLTRESGKEPIQPLRVHHAKLEFLGSEELLSPSDFAKNLNQEIAKVYQNYHSISALMRRFQSKGESKVNTGTLFVFEFSNQYQSIFTLFTLSSRIGSRKKDNQIWFNQYSIEACSKYHLVSDNNQAFVSFDEVQRKLDCKPFLMPFTVQNVQWIDFDFVGQIIPSLEIERIDQKLIMLSSSQLDASPLQRREYRIGEKLYYRWFFPQSTKVFYSKAYGDYEFVLTNFARDLTLDQRYKIQAILP